MMGVDEGVFDPSEADLLSAKVSGPCALHFVIIIVGRVSGI
jgi:hypothetical protein